MRPRSARIEMTVSRLSRTTPAAMRVSASRRVTTCSPTTGSEGSWARSPTCRCNVARPCARRRIADHRGRCAASATANPTLSRVHSVLVCRRITRPACDRARRDAVRIAAAALVLIHAEHRTSGTHARCVTVHVHHRLAAERTAQHAGRVTAERGHLRGKSNRAPIAISHRMPLFGRHSRFRIAQCRSGRGEPEPT